MAGVLHNNNNPWSSNNPVASEIRYCDVCNVAKISWSHHLRTNLHKQLSGTQISDNLRCIRSAFRNRIETYIITNHISTINQRTSDHSTPRSSKKSRQYQI